MRIEIEYDDRELEVHYTPDDDHSIDIEAIIENHDDVLDETGDFDMRNIIYETHEAIRLNDEAKQDDLGEEMYELSRGN